MGKHSRIKFLSLSFYKKTKTKGHISPGNLFRLESKWIVPPIGVLTIKTKHLPKWYQVRLCDLQYGVHAVGTWATSTIAFPSSSLPHSRQEWLSQSSVFTNWSKHIAEHIQVRTKPILALIHLSQERFFLHGWKALMCLWWLNISAFFTNIKGVPLLILTYTVG